jgi:16S rRNA (adenine1518-N6/adenine1519-N6)-dimethyltransferase
VVAVEFDPSLAQALPGQVPASNLTIVHEDILKFDLTSIPPGYKIVANIPYYLTSNLIRTISESTNPPERAVLLVQKEVAERVTARPGDMSLLSVSAQFYWTVSLGREIPANLFTPPPKVDSKVLVLRRRPKPLFDDDPKQFFRLVRAGFNNRRKTLLNSLSGGLQRSKPDVSALLSEIGLNPTARPQELSLEDWHNLYRRIYK